MSAEFCSKAIMDSGRCPRCGYVHVRKQTRDDYNPAVEVVFCNRCGNVSVHELQKAGLPP